MSMDEDAVIRALADLRTTAPPTDLAARCLADAALAREGRTRPAPGPLLTGRMLRDARRVAGRRRWQDQLALCGLAASGIIGVMVGLHDPGAVVIGTASEAAGYLGAYDFQFAGTT